MASRKRPERPPLEVKTFSLADIDRGINKLRRRAADLTALDPKLVPYNDARVSIVEGNVRDAIRDVFGENSPEFRDHQHDRIWHGDINMYDEDSDRQEKFAAGIPQMILMVEGLISRLEERREDALPDVEAGSAFERPRVLTPTRRVFVVHGHDEGAKDAVARLLTKLSLEPIILHEQANAGQTIIEKFELHADVDFAIVLLTPDDLGYSAKGPESARPRARQNVVFELGYFIAKLGRKRVCALHKVGVEILSDYSGVLYVPMDENNAWHFQIAKEIRAAGIAIDLNRIA